MPAPGDQHRGAATATNPFEEVKPRVNEYTAQEKATLASRLEKQLGPEYISSRPGASGQKVHYLAAEKCINLANEVFGFNGWSSSIQSTQIDFVDESQSSGKISLGLSVIMRVTLRDGTYHEDVGYGHIENCKGKAAAFEKAKKEATTDALKRTLRNFGNILGNCIYDKEYLAKVTRIKIAPTRWDPDNLHRHPDFAPIKKESIEDAEYTKSTSTLDGEDEFGGDELDDADFSVANSGHPDEITLDRLAHPESLKPRGNTTNNGQAPPAGERPDASVQQARPPPPYLHPSGPQTPTNPRNVHNFQPQGRTGAQQNYNANGTHKPSNRPVQQYQQNPQNIPPTILQRPQIPPPHAQQNPTGLQTAKLASLSGPNSPNQKRQHHQHQPQHQQSTTLPKSTPPVNDPPTHPPPAQDPPPINVAFVTARAADSLQNINTNNAPTLPQPPATALFNPHSESPSIRKTAGIDHRISKPIVRESVGSGPAHSTNAILAQALGTGIGTGRSHMTSNFVNPQADQNRRIGMPPAGMASPLQNRNSYKPPTMVAKRGLGPEQQGFGQVPGQGQQRPPLVDVTVGSVNVPVGEAGIGVGGGGGGATAGGGDVKRQRVGNGEGAGRTVVMG